MEPRRGWYKHLSLRWLLATTTLRGLAAPGVLLAVLACVAWSPRALHVPVAAGGLVLLGLNALAFRRWSARECAGASDEQFRLLVDGVEDHAICMLDAGGRFRSWSKAAERIFGHSAGEIIGQ